MTSFLDRSAGYLIHITAQLLKRELSSLLRRDKINVTPQQWAILNRLNENLGLTQSEVAALTFKDNANITHIIDKLEHKELIQRKVDPNDRRTWRVYITKSGQKVRDQIEELATEALASATQGISQKEVDVFNCTAKKIIENLAR